MNIKSDWNYAIVMTAIIAILTCLIVDKAFSADLKGTHAFASVNVEVIYVYQADKLVNVELGSLSYFADVESCADDLLPKVRKLNEENKDGLQYIGECDEIADISKPLDVL
jgi:hypothetical protein